MLTNYGLNKIQLSTGGSQNGKILTRGRKCVLIEKDIYGGDHHPFSTLILIEIHIMITHTPQKWDIKYSI